MRILPVLFCLMACISAAAESTPIQLKVMSFNVRYGTADDGPDSWERRKDILGPCVAKFAPDVMGTQECLDFQADFIAATHPEYRWFGPGREADGGGERMAVFYRHSELAPIRTGNFWLSETPGSPGSKSWYAACPRMVTWAEFYHFKSAQRFYIFNTHFDHMSHQARVESAKLLAVRMNEIAEDAPVLVTGDFNAMAEKTEPWEVLTGAGLKDAWLAASKSSGPTDTYTAFKGPPPEARGGRIDWVLFKGPIKAVSCEAVTFNEEGRYPSDHLPIYAEMVLYPSGPDQSAK